jgi:hypothetical protein
VSPPSASQQRLRVVERTGATDRFVSVRCKILHFLPVSLNQSSFIIIFESSIMRKIGPGSRLGCRACCVSGMALSECGFAFNTRLVYFVSEQVFPSEAYFKSALPLYDHEGAFFIFLLCRVQIAQTQSAHKAHEHAHATHP